MILSVQRKFIFLKTSKTAGTSLEIALSKYALPDDIVTPINPVDEEIRRNLGHAGPQNYLAPPGLLQKLGLKRPEMKFYNHIRANLIREHLGHDVFATYLKVAVVRNPYDMAVSRYYWAHRNHAQLTEAHFRQWLLSRPKTLYKNYKITHIDGVSVIDLMIRYENFREDLEVFARRAGLPDTLFQEFSAIKSKANFRPKRATAQDMFRGFDEGKKVVEEMFAEDIETYGYKCP
jgi:hypothetical protein